MKRNKRKKIVVEVFRIQKDIGCLRLRGTCECRTMLWAKFVLKLWAGMNEADVRKGGRYAQECKESHNWNPEIRAAVIRVNGMPRLCYDD